MTAVDGPEPWPLPPQRTSVGSDEDNGKGNGRDSLVIDLSKIRNPDFALTSASASVSPPLRIAKEGTEILGWIANTPLVVMVLLRVSQAALHHFAIDELDKYSSKERLVSAFVWYLCFLSIETGLRWSPTLNRILTASQTESTMDIIAKLTEADTVRLETHMTCYREFTEDVRDIAWTGKAKFPCSLVQDTTIVAEDIFEYKAVLLDFGSQIEFADSRSRNDYEKVRSRTRRFSKRHTGRVFVFAALEILTFTLRCLLVYVPPAIWEACDGL